MKIEESNDIYHIFLSWSNDEVMRHLAYGAMFATHIYDGVDEEKHESE